MEKSIIRKNLLIQRKQLITPLLQEKINNSINLFISQKYNILQNKTITQYTPLKGEPILNIPLPSEKYHNTIDTDCDVIFIPCVGFNKEKYRIGYGSGYFDKYLYNKNIIKIGCAWSFSEVNFIHGIHDIPMDFIITDEKWF